MKEHDLKGMEQTMANFTLLRTLLYDLTHHNITKMSEEYQNQLQAEITDLESVVGEKDRGIERNLSRLHQSLEVFLRVHKRGD